MHEWLSGGVSPCQGEGRGFESRLVLSIRCEKEEISDGYLLFFACSSSAGLERFECLRFAPVVAGERPPDVLRRLVLFLYKKEISVGYLLFRTFRFCRARMVRSLGSALVVAERLVFYFFTGYACHAQLGKEFPRCRAVAL